MPVLGRSTCRPNESPGLDDWEFAQQSPSLRAAAIPLELSDDWLGSKIGVWAWSFVGFVVATIIVITALAAVSEIVLPLIFAAVLAVVFKPLVGKLERRRLKPTLAAGLVVLGLIALMTSS